jgi:hypothetical protein
MSFDSKFFFLLCEIKSQFTFLFQQGTLCIVCMYIKAKVIFLSHFHFTSRCQTTIHTLLMIRQRTLATQRYLYHIQLLKKIDDSVETN